MYDLADRDQPIKSSTGALVGPNTYVLCHPPDKKQNCVPFLSTKSKSELAQRLNTEAIYDIRYFRPKIKGGQSLRNKSSRFVYKQDDLPPPTRYNPKPIQCKKRLKLDPTKPKLYLCNVPHSVSVVAPSIPTKIDENGYDIDDDGNIVKVPPKVSQIEEAETKTTLSNKGWRWSCRNSQRFNDKQYVSCGPGPAAYFREVPRCLKAEEDEWFREMARRFSFLPRFIEAQEIKAQKQMQPGPGSYDVTCQKKCKMGESIKSKPFISGTDRFSVSKSGHSPGPGDYEIHDRKKKQFSIKCAPFGFQSDRFQKKKLQKIPGPGDYEVKSPLMEKIERKSNPFALCTPPFNSTKFRDLNFAAKDAPNMPSAADYPEDKEEEEKKILMSSVFMNNVCRFASLADKKYNLSPTQYKAAESFEKIRNQKTFNIAKLAFNFSGVRSKFPEAKQGVPPPGSYETKYEFGCKGRHFNVSPRFVCEKVTPGPGSYNIHPRIQESIYKACDTYNLRLKENTLRKKLRLAPFETRKRWMGKLKKNKLLKWFDVELDFEERIIMKIHELFDKPI